MLFTIDDPFDRSEQYDNLAEEVAAFLEEEGVDVIGVSPVSGTGVQCIDVNLRNLSSSILVPLFEDVGVHVTRHDTQLPNYETGSSRVWFQRNDK